MPGKKKITYYTKEFEEYVARDKELEYEQQEVLAYLVEVFLKLWYKPTENLESFKKWFSQRISKYNINALQLEDIIDKFDDYWGNPEVRDVKNFKSTFFNSFHLRPFLKRGYEAPVNINNL